ncbi:MAG: hypothetical protein LBV40_03420 [Methanomicrobiales archaeon]|jgi:hypothetical protein|nr:hypothetical protein [Methanomicrobiales archaeon]
MTLEHEVANRQALFELWFIMAERIAPPMCCTNPPPMLRLFREAVHEMAPGGDMEKAIEKLTVVVSHADPLSSTFSLAGQLFNIIDWRRTYHPEWNTLHEGLSGMRLGECGSYVARAMAMMQVAQDGDALELADKVIARNVEHEHQASLSDDLKMARLIRAAVLICRGDIVQGEEEFGLIVVLQEQREKNVSD